MLQKLAISVDIGGSHITTVFFDLNSGSILEETKTTSPVNSRHAPQQILSSWEQCFKSSVEKFKATPQFNSNKTVNQDPDGAVDIHGVGFSMPGPFDYERGLLKMKNLDKYDRMYGISIKPWLMSMFPCLKEDLIIFDNDANCFLKGHGWKKLAEKYRRLVGITLGTGFGSSFMEDGKIISYHRPETTMYYNHPFKGAWADDSFSTRWFIKRWKELSGQELNGVKDILQQSDKKDLVNSIFKEFSENLSEFLVEKFNSYTPDCFVIGGSIANASDHFVPILRQNLYNNGFNIEIVIDTDSENTALRGTVSDLEKLSKMKTVRKTAQHLLPLMKTSTNLGRYDIYPSFQLPENLIFKGLEGPFIAELMHHKTVIIDGYVGIFWNEILASIITQLKKENVNHINVYDISTALKTETEINEMLSPWLGGDDPIFGKIYPGNLVDFFDSKTLSNIVPEIEGDCINIIYGCGASLAGWKGLNIYIDIPKNEIQFRMRSGSCLNLGTTKFINNPKQMYKRFYFVDWVVLNRMKCKLLPSMDIIIDGQRLDSGMLTWMRANDFRYGLDEMSKNALRVRPWFEPGAWGGQWIKEKIDGLNKDVINYAWSFELIVPENGILFESSQYLLEASFDFLMFQQHENILGRAAKRFVYEFPIRFDFLDTFDGGNLSVQCHPKTSYMKEHFGETFTQDESYYILDSAPGSEVYLGFHHDIDSKVFRDELEHSFKEGTVIDIEKYVQKHPSKKHDLFLIPNGTIHCSGINNLVLEISSTPYIYTFKMYDWIRLDLDGKPRPLNIERGFQNLEFSRKGQKVKDEHISKVNLNKSGNDWELYDLTSHPELFYAVSRVEFMNEFEYETDNKCLVMSLVEGEHIELFTKERKMIINYAETFIVPAAANRVKLINKSKTKAKVVIAYVKPVEE